MGRGKKERKMENLRAWMLRNKKILIWFGLAIASAVFFSWIFGGLVMGLAIMLMIGLHEGGHLMAAKWCGYKTGGFYFLPGLGGVALAGEEATTRRHNFLIYYGGPLTGAILVVILAAIYFGLGQAWPMPYQGVALRILASWAFINLFNLFPIYPLDGGGLLWALFRSFWKGYSPWGARVINILATAGFYLYTHNWIWTGLLLFFGWIGVKAQHAADIQLVKKDLWWHEIVRGFIAYLVLVAFFIGGVILAVNQMIHLGIV